jgi:hypothetical protein
VAGASEPVPPSSRRWPLPPRHLLPPPFFPLTPYDGSGEWIQRYGGVAPAGSGAGEPPPRRPAPSFLYLVMRRRPRAPAAMGSASSSMGSSSGRGGQVAAMALPRGEQRPSSPAPASQFPSPILPASGPRGELVVFLELLQGGVGAARWGQRWRFRGSARGCWERRQRDRGGPVAASRTPSIRAKDEGKTSERLFAIPLAGRRFGRETFIRLLQETDKGPSADGLTLLARRLCLASGVFEPAPCFTFTRRLGLLAVGIWIHETKFSPTKISLFERLKFQSLLTKEGAKTSLETNFLSKGASTKLCFSSFSSFNLIEICSMPHLLEGEGEKGEGERDINAHLLHFSLFRIWI